MAFDVSDWYGQAAQGDSVQVTLSYGASTDDLLLCCVEWDNLANTVDSVTSPNVTWTFFYQRDHNAAGQGFRYYYGKVNTAFSSSTETVTAALSWYLTAWRGITVVRVPPEAGKVFVASPIHSSSSGYWGDGTTPTSTDGMTCGLTLTGSNTFQLIGWLAFHGDGNTGPALSAGTNFTEQCRRSRQGTDSPVMVESRSYGSAGTPSVSATCTYANNTAATIVGFALEQVAAAVAAVNVARVARFVGGAA